MNTTNNIDCQVFKLLKNKYPKQANSDLYKYQVIFVMNSVYCSFNHIIYQ